MKQLRNLSARPTLLVDDHGRRVVDNATSAGIPGPFGRERIVTALPTNRSYGPRQLTAAVIVHDAGLCYLADPDGNAIGEPAVIVHRMLAAAPTAVTRRF
jgi:hypothetical protein